MKRYVVLFAVIVVSVACQDKNSSNIHSNKYENTFSERIHFIIADRYFIANSLPKQNTKIETEGEFNYFFHPAAVMGKGGLPIKIDFNSDYVIALTKPETSIETEKKVELILNFEDRVQVNYSVLKAKEVSYTMKPALVVVVEKKYNAKIEFNEVK